MDGRLRLGVRGPAHAPRRGEVRTVVRDVEQRVGDLTVGVVNEDVVPGREGPVGAGVVDGPGGTLHARDTLVLERTGDAPARQRVSGLERHARLDELDAGRIAVRHEGARSVRLDDRQAALVRADEDDVAVLRTLLDRRLDAVRQDAARVERALARVGGLERHVPDRHRVLEQDRLDRGDGSGRIRACGPGTTVRAHLVRPHAAQLELELAVPLAEVGSLLAELPAVAGDLVHGVAERRLVVVVQDLVGDDGTELTSHLWFLPQSACPET